MRLVGFPSLPSAQQEDVEVFPPPPVEEEEDGPDDIGTRLTETPGNRFKCQ